MKGQRKGLLSLLMIFLIIGIIVPIFMNTNVEGLTPGNYPVSVSKPLLFDSYNVKKNPGISMNGNKENYKDYPLYQAHHLGTNNKRYWETPNNGMCSPPDFCGGIYEKTPQKILGEPKGPNWNESPRVNYYVSKSN